MAQTSSPSQAKLIVAVAVTAVALLSVGMFILYQDHGSALMAFIFMAAGLFAAFAGGIYLGVWIPILRAREQKIIGAKSVSLSDLIEWRVSSSDFPWPEDERIVGRDWALFLSQPPMSLKCDAVNVLGERLFVLDGHTVVVAYVVCEDFNLDKHVPVFEGWVLHAPGMRDEKEFAADHSRTNPLIAAIASVLALIGYGIVGYILQQSWSKLTGNELAMIFAGIAGVSVVAFLAYAKSFTRAKFSKSLKRVPEQYKDFCRSLISSDQIEFFRVLGGPTGLLILAQPVGEQDPLEHHGVVPLEGPQGAALDAILDPIFKQRTHAPMHEQMRVSG